MDNDNRFCFNEDICTARCNCWDGEEMRNDDISEFDLNDIEDQGSTVTNYTAIDNTANITHIDTCTLYLGQNPAFNFDPNVLRDEAERIGDPVAGFLASEEFSSVAPEGVEVLVKLM